MGVVSLIPFLFLFHYFFAAKHHRLSQPGGSQRLSLPAGGHGGTPVHAPAGEGGADGRHGGAQRPARGAAGRGLRITSHVQQFEPAGGETFQYVLFIWLISLPVFPPAAFSFHACSERF